jgi:hypothetical protein
LSLYRRNPRRDRNEASIVKALRRAGAQVWYLSGSGIPDLLTEYRGRWLPLEVKGEAGKLTPRQTWPNVPVVQTEDEALRSIGALKATDSARVDKGTLRARTGSTALTDGGNQ